ncbi:CtsR family transcriptional regulator [Isobaculum melis]|nr:CtsR family transcriptional regulator [Isobaculum melis]
MSDIIEAYLKQVLSQDEQIEIKRNEIADQFKCVPSQINYVINTRFTIEKGYLVESKRGGGGYIRIAKVKLLDDVEIIDALIDLIGTSISYNDAYSLISRLYEDEIISKREGTLMLAAIDKQTLAIEEPRACILRACILKSLFKNLKYEE